MMHINCKLKRLFLFAVLAITASCQINKPEKIGFLSTDGTSFIDNQGRTVILNGLNHVTKVPENSFLYDGDKELFRQFKEWGFNCIRYGLYWDVLEPEPGKINEGYLKEVDKRVKWAEENNLWLILDMHQDLYGRKFGNGAPLWATLDEGLPHVKGDVWSDAYIMSPAVQKSFDNFWSNKPAEDGVGLQDHYINAWKTVAARYANAPSVVGFDIMNEPFMGTSGLPAFQKLLEGFAEVHASLTGEILTEEAIISMWNTEDSRLEAYALLNDGKVFSHVVSKISPLVDEFEQGALSDFYQRVRDAIREVNTKHILFLEHNFFCNLGVPSRFCIPKDKEGRNDPLCAYAPHGYDLVTDSKASMSQGYGRLDFLFRSMFKRGDELQIPTLVGEWGAFYMGGDYKEPAIHIINQIEKSKAGQTYWAFWEGIDTQDYFKYALGRYYPMAINGKLLDYYNDYQSNKFSFRWNEGDKNALTRIYVPNISMLKDTERISLNPSSSFSIIPIGKTNAGYLEIQPAGGERLLTLPVIE
ncbi:cellulase family glycosylhydrolase [Parabacteroides sp. BX2]|jgi:endoglycosylceramidase|uniref:Cellulase family glycosylhydrolase n=1 Tax=Parabacteroides segnis TaxID=2763058 RepID=A0ABR7DVL8_9BACT|nr:cellulase family glycosylhydrolase [Parabacteroides segnis]MBC5641531.1 cellulase family glycosylhydrolase [Parabacteroides segnis]MCM0711280.1 cellulase family glycosylhydrolase [Parabacteroides sp. TA-V-105]